jgi:hypothetical protein
MTVYTLQRLYTFPMRSDFISCFQVTNISISPMPAKHMHTSFGVRPGDHFKAFQWLPLVCTCPLRFHRRCKHLTSHQGPPLVPCGSEEYTLRSPHIPSQRIPAVQHSPRIRLAHTSLVSTTYLARPRPYLAHGCTVIMGCRSMNRSLDLG